MSGIMNMLVGGAPAVTITLTPGDQSFTDSSPTGVFALENAIASGGVATAWSWYFINELGGTWSFTGTTNTASATPRVTGAPFSELVSATVVCDVTVGGVVYSGSASLQYGNF